MSSDGRSAVPPERWFPVYEALMHGLIHACNNRVAALSGITQLHEAQLSTSDEGMQQLAVEVEKLRQLMLMFRAASSSGGARREPMHMAEALRTAAALLAFHHDVRSVPFTAPEDAPDVEPVYLWPADPLRFALLAYLSVAQGLSRGSGVATSVARVLDETLVTMTAPGVEASVKARPEYVTLAEAAALEGGSLSCATGPAGSVMLLLALPGQQKATARG